MFKTAIRLPLLLVATASFLTACGDDDPDYCADLAVHCETCDLADGKPTCDSHVSSGNQDVCKADLDGDLCQ